MTADSLISGYRLVFEPHLIVESYPATLWIAVPVLLGVAVLVRRRFRAYALAAATLAAVGMLYLRSVHAGVNRVMAQRFETLQRAARERTTPMVEGPVQAFRATVVEGHQAESFTVAGVSFAYSDYAATGAFNQTRSHGGPMRAGLRVRIRYVPLLGENAIVRLEVADSAGVLLAAQGPTTPAAQIVGTWRGTSTCVDRQVDRACRDEEVIFDIDSAAGPQGPVSIRADKVVQGVRQPMGAFRLSYDSSTASWSTEFSTARFHGRWTYEVRDSAMTGRLSEVPSRRLVRRSAARRTPAR